MAKPLSELIRIARNMAPLGSGRNAGSIPRRGRALIWLDGDQPPSDHQHGQLTDNQTADLESRLDAMADQIHWAHQEAFAKPW